MKKRILALVLCIVMVLSITVITSAEDTDVPADAATHVDTEETPATPVCTCGTEDETHAEDCPLFVKSEEPEEEEEEQEEETFDREAHMGECFDLCMDESCTCVCHLVEKLLATTDIEAFFILVESMTEEQYDTITDEQNAQLEAHLKSIEPEPEPEIVLELTTDVPVPSEIVYVAVDYTDVAPFGEPVSGK